MNSKLASDKTLAVIDQYLHFRYGGATISVPYYNNNHKAVRAGLRGVIGKGSPRDIFDEVEIAMAKGRQAVPATPGMSPVTSAPSGAVKNGSFVPDALTSETLKHFLVDQNIGIDCSGFIFYVMNAEYAAHGKGSLDRHFKFPYSKGLLGKIRSKMRPAENADVASFAHDKNSRIIPLKEIEPGDIITMSGSPEGKERDHILFIHQVDYQNFLPITIHYSHSMAWPSDGAYGHGVRQGTIEITDLNKPITEQKWLEADKVGTIGNGQTSSAQSENYTFTRATKARTEIRRMLSL